MILLGGILTTVAVAYLYMVYRPQPPVIPAPRSVALVENVVTRTLTSTPPAATSTPLRSATEMPTQSPTISPSSTSTEEPLIWQDVDFGDGTITVAKFMLNDCVENVYTEPFHPWAWFEGIFDTAFFDPHQGGVVAWEDTEGRIILWLHSGPQLTISPLQVFLERDERGYTLTPEETQQKLDDCVIGSWVEIVQDNLSFNGKVVAAARVLPTDVLEINQHVMDLPQTLLAKEIGSGWQEIIDNPHSLTFYFCGRRLSGEDNNSRLLYWQQARFVIGIVPIH